MACFNSSVLQLLTSSEADIQIFCRNRGVIPSSSLCTNCNTQMTWTSCSATRYRDGSCWRCPNCGLYRSIRHNSILDQQNITFTQFIWLLHAFSNKNNSNVNIAEYTGLSEHSVSVWVGKLLTCLAEYLFQNPVVLGGHGVVVEVDESKYGKRKYNRGSRRDGNWVLGMLERGRSDRCHFIPLPGNSRSGATLIPLIMNFVRPGSIVMTDGWSGYNSLPRRGYYHFVVNHSIQYVNPITGVHINTMEGLWTHCKKHVNGNKYITDSLIDYMWRKRINGTSGTSQIQNTWTAALDCLKDVYGN